MFVVKSSRRDSRGGKFHRILGSLPSGDTIKQMQWMSDAGHQVPISANYFSLSSVADATSDNVLHLKIYRNVLNL